MDSDLQQLQATWQAFRVATGAGLVPDELARQLQYDFAGDRVTMLEGGRPTGVGTVTVHPAAIPKGIDVAILTGRGRVKWRWASSKSWMDAYACASAPSGHPRLLPRGRHRSLSLSASRMPSLRTC